MGVLSFSIDLGGSTSAKVQIKKICPDEHRYQEVLKAYFEILLNVEARLYTQCYHAGIPLEQIYLVKGIGDELWYLIDLAEVETDIVAKLIRILSDVTGYVARLNISERSVTFEEEKDNPDIWDRVENAQLNLAFKCYLEVLEDCHNFSDYRVGFICQKLRNLVDKKGHTISQKEFDDLIGKTAAHLNLGILIPTGQNKHLGGIRYDPIGVDVDYFFRVSKHVLPGYVTLGERFVNMFADILDGKKLRILKDKYKNVSYSYYPFLKRHIPESYLKGTERACDVFLLLTLNCHSVHSSRENQSDPCEDTRTLLINEGFLLEEQGTEKDKAYGIKRYKRDLDKWPNTL